MLDLGKVKVGDIIHWCRTPDQRVFNDGFMGVEHMIGEVREVLHDRIGIMWIFDNNEDGSINDSIHWSPIPLPGEELLWERYARVITEQEKMIIMLKA